MNFFLTAASMGCARTDVRMEHTCCGGTCPRPSAEGALWLVLGLGRLSWECEFLLISFSVVSFQTPVLQISYKQLRLHMSRTMT